MREGVTPNVWLFSAKVDVMMFSGVAVASACCAFIASFYGIDETPPWLWLVLVVGIDVAHVWSTAFRVYLDAAEVKRRPLLYLGAPLLAWSLGVAAYSFSAEFFWRVLAYVAVWHFIRQQTGWMVLYGRRTKDTDASIRFDVAAMWAVTLGPIVWWHANLPRSFWWFKEGDFVDGLPHWVGTAALSVHAAVLVLWLVRQLRVRHLGKVLLLAATWLAWFGGIVVARSDFTFTIMNVALHGVPYLVLTRRYSVGRAAEQGYGAISALIRRGLPVFIGALLLVAFAEEFLWDRLIWHEHVMFFGVSQFDAAALAVLIVPLLATPQVTHYLLDGFVWKARDNPGLATRLGWSQGSPVPTER